MRIGILKADSVLPDLAAHHGEYPDMFREVLVAAEPTAEVVSFDAEHGELPTESDACDRYVITGSRRSVYEEIPWIADLAAWARRAETARTPLVGVCFGHQLIAQALGGRTEKADRGWTIGVQEYSLDRPFIPRSPPLRRPIHSHRDQVTALPASAERIGGNAACPVALYRMAPRALRQGHPEFSPSTRAISTPSGAPCLARAYAAAVASPARETTASTSVAASSTSSAALARTRDQRRARRVAGCALARSVPLSPPSVRGRPSVRGMRGSPSRAASVSASARESPP
jgi:GMP synthase-like glutamine amidotransferase